METDTRPSQRLESPILSIPILNVDVREENSSEIILCSKDVNVVDLHLESDLPLKESSYKWETRTFEKIHVDSIDRNIGKEFDNNLMEPCVIKMETIYLSETAADEVNYHREETCSNDELEPALTFEEGELNQRESDFSLRETICFERIEIESIDRNIDEDFENNVMELCTVKKETIDVDEMGAEEFPESPFKSEIEQEEINIKDEQDNKYELNKKLRNRKQNVLHQCPECSYSTTNKYNLKSHLVRHKKPDEIGWYSCPECPYKCARKRSLKYHSVRHNPAEGIGWYSCPECPYKCTAKKNLQYHSIKHKKFDEIDWYRCQECPYKTSRKDKLRSHAEIHNICVLKCSKCSYETLRPSKLKKHLSEHENTNPEQNEIFKCTECPYESGYKYHLNAHQLVHDQSRWLQCPDCAYKTPYRSLIKKHQLQHQGENAEGWHKCPQCSYKTAHKSSLRCHLMTHKSADEIRWFECPQCSFKSARERNLIRHQMKHKQAHEIKWFRCYECSFKTKYKSCLPKHMSKHKKQNNGK